MGLLAVMGPSRKDHLGFPRLSSRSRSKARVRSQKARTSRSCAGKSTFGSPLSNAMIFCSCRCEAFALRFRSAIRFQLDPPPPLFFQQDGPVVIGALARRAA